MNFNDLMKLPPHSCMPLSCRLAADMVVVELGPGLSTALFPQLDSYTVAFIFSSLTLSDVIRMASTCRALYRQCLDFRRIEGQYAHLR